MKAPPKQKRAPGKSAFRKLLLRGSYHVAALEARLWGLPFWTAEQRRTRLQDLLANEGREL
jgi:hypothetical protein